jgi:hypothetical protein
VNSKRPESHDLTCAEIISTSGFERLINVWPLEESAIVGEHPVHGDPVPCIRLEPIGSCKRLTRFYVNVSLYSYPGRPLDISIPNSLGRPTTANVLLITRFFGEIFSIIQPIYDDGTNRYVRLARQHYQPNHHGE